MDGIPQPDRDALDSARWMAYDAANEYLAEQRSMRGPRRPHDPPAPSGKLLHSIQGFRHFRYVVSPWPRGMYEDTALMARMHDTPCSARERTDSRRILIGRIP